MEDLNFRKGDAKTDVFGSDRMLQPSPVEKIPDGPTTPEVAYQMVKDETFAQTQPRLNLATFVTTYMDEYATKLMNEAININYIDETEYPRIAVMNGKCINIVANLWNSPEKDTWKTGALAIGSSEACMLGGVAAWLRWRKKRQAQGKPFDKPNFVISCAGVRKDRLKANHSINQISLFQQVSRWYGRSLHSCGRLKCVKCL